MKSCITSIRIGLPHSGGLSLHARKWGDSVPRFFFIHGLGDGYFIWNHVIPAILPYGSAIAIDLRGHGDSDRAPDGKYTIASHVDDALRALQMLCPAPVVIIGHSLGAEVALHLAATHRKRMLGAVLVDGGPQLNRAGIAHIHREFSKQLWSYSTPEHYLSHLQEKLPLSKPEVLRDLAPYALRRDPAGGYELKCDSALIGKEEFRETDDEALWSIFRSIAFPFLVVRGKGSAILPQTTIVRMTQENAHCSAQIIASAGHSVMLDNPSGFIAALDSYISTLLQSAVAAQPFRDASV